MQINLTLIIQIINVGVTLFVLRVTLLRPIIAFIEKRNENYAIIENQTIRQESEVKKCILTKERNLYAFRSDLIKKYTTAKEDDVFAEEPFFNPPSLQSQSIEGTQLKAEQIILRKVS